MLTKDLNSFHYFTWDCPFQLSKCTKRLSQLWTNSATTVERSAKNKCTGVPHKNREEEVNAVKNKSYHLKANNYPSEQPPWDTSSHQCLLQCHQLPYPLINRFTSQLLASAIITHPICEGATTSSEKWWRTSELSFHECPFLYEYCGYLMKGVLQLEKQEKHAALCSVRGRYISGDSWHWAVRHCSSTSPQHKATLSPQRLLLWPRHSTRCFPINSVDLVVPDKATRLLEGLRLGGTGFDEEQVFLPKLHKLSQNSLASACTASASVLQLPWPCAPGNRVVTSNAFAPELPARFRDLASPTRAARSCAKQGTR